MKFIHRTCRGPKLPSPVKIAIFTTVQNAANQKVLNDPKPSASHVKGDLWTKMAGEVNKAHGSTLSKDQMRSCYKRICLEVCNVHVFFTSDLSERVQAEICNVKFFFI